MSKKIDYTVARVPSNDWDNIMETVTLDGSFSEEIKDEVWTAIENTEYFSNPWVVVTLANGKANARIFNNKDSAQKHINRAKKKLNTNQQFFCIKGQYQSAK